MARRKKPQLVSGVQFTGIADKGRAVGRDAEGRVIFAEGAAPGDVADVLVTRKKKGVLMGAAQAIHTLSPDRAEPFCQHFDHCGGCKWQHLNYDAQARHKERVVHDALSRIGKVDVEAMLPIKAAAQATFYRNKLEFSFSNKRWLTRAEIDSGISNQEDVLGFHPAGAFDKIIDIEKCWLQPDPSNALRNGIKALAIEQGLSFHDARAHEGFLRQVMFRITSVGETLVLLSFHEDDPKRYKPFMDELMARFPQITTLCYCINTKLNDFLYDLDMYTYAGKGYVEERLGEVRFKVGPKSFFQTNTSQAKVLYDTVVEFAGLNGTENVYDLYTGIGSIALYVAQACRQVVGIEEIPEAIADAEENARLNDIQNTVFYAGDVKDILTPEFAQRHGKPDLLITDPPRAGMHAQVVDMLLQLSAPRMVYVSCNPATQARDLQLLSSRYRVAKAQPVDMFPHTHHIENVALLELR
ncbi:23S rRNA (uracil(1939)-C(5))-methyltransferase RlmD [Phaeodactylibacter luteus]|uniref:23S rRNA (Uracil(1939)-C(5))-methyltransferase RlmD n=1 Tax=Phaeodactylibacter luteus TaxID=1564516 RepID=A0A5C6S308_9BACT|nr:23S rRNA (uracil(1939)-C(5))-methyltransferase RlmD [Phaeodactylibacter luteus]TXB68002.1 23S rRNA (uracil(1939)-C(5))-methyltransferase RlmD [Phaeodactylibacter luteus]